MRDSPDLVNLYNMHKHLDILATQIRKTAVQLDEVTELVETQKWGQQSFLPKKPRVGTTIRIDQHDDSHVAMYVHCQTTLVDTYRSLFPELTYEGNRAVLFNVNEPLPKDTIDVLVEEALLYHVNKRKR